MSLNCPHAWEEYKKLDLARHELREEFLALRSETEDFKNVSREKVEQWRELHGKVKGVEGGFSDFYSNEFFMLYRAKEIMGNQFFGPEEIENAFGFEVSPEKIPKIPYSREELKKAKELGERLVLRISEDSDGNPMTMEHINDLGQARMTKDEGKLLDNTDDWYKNEDFFIKQSLKTEWKLVGNDLLNGSKDKNYSNQTKVLRDYLLSVGALTSEELEECSDENLAKIGFDVKKLAELKINQNHRRTPGEVLYDWFLHFKKFKDRDYLEKNHDWTNIVSSGGFLVNVGSMGSGGALVYGHVPAFRGDGIGVVSVR